MAPHERFLYLLPLRDNINIWCVLRVSPLDLVTASGFMKGASLIIKNQSIKLLSFLPICQSPVLGSKSLKVQTVVASNHPNEPQSANKHFFNDLDNKDIDKHAYMLRSFRMCANSKRL